MLITPSIDPSDNPNGKPGELSPISADAQHTGDIPGDPSVTEAYSAMAGSDELCKEPSIGVSLMNPPSSSTQTPGKILTRSVLLLLVIVCVPSVIYNLLMPTPLAIAAMTGQLVVVISTILGLAWVFLFIYFVNLYRRSWKSEPRFATVLAVLMLDAFRNVVESAYFGLAFSEKSHFLPSDLEKFLWAPQVIIISRLLALATACVILWLVMERGFENLKLREQHSLLMEQRNRELTALRELSALVSGTLDVQTVLHRVCREVVETLTFQSALLCLVDPQTRTVRAAAGYGVADGLIEETQRDLDGPDILADVVRTGATEILTGWDPRFNKETFERFSHIRQVRIFAPIQDAQGTVGVVEVTVKRSAGAPDQHAIDLLHSFLRHASTAIRNARLHERVVQDRERLNLLTHSLEDKNKQLESFVYMISHDLKAPLVSIQGFLSLLAEECSEGLGEDGRFYLSRVRGNAEHLQGLIQQLLELSRIGRLEGAHVVVDVNAMIAEITESLRSRLDVTKIKVIIQPDLPAVSGEPTQLRQLFFNLLDNAIKYMGDSSGPLIEISGATIGNMVEYQLKDTGMGIPSDLQDRVFQMFQRAPNPGQSVEGNGVGLAIVQKIADTHGGRVWVESEGSGHGSTFHVSLPQESSPIGESHGAA